MNRYRNLGGNSGVRAYEIGSDSIVVEFSDSGTYRYTHASTGASHVERMKRLAEAGQGLATYINQHVRDRYDSRLD